MSTSKGASSQSLLDVGSLAKGSATEEKEKDSEGTPERPTSPDAVKCAICLGDVVNRSCSNSCAHQFCFGCLLEWSKVKPECPLCKSSFRSIYHNFRSSTEYDEYTVPAPAVPHLSIRFHASAAGNYRLSPFIRVLEARAAQMSPMGHHHHHSIGPEGVSVGLASLFQPPPPSSMMMMGSNPFNTASSSSSLRAEYFGDILNEFRNQEDASQMRGYQNRRRRYDRNEWVQPFGSTLQPGSVIFPSMEYIRSHPSAAGRLRSWLYRELNVLLGIHRNRDQLGFIYDLIMHLLTHYDIRSRDFRDSINSYFGARTSHFQHELYHFLLSGMGMEEYDRVAEYPSSASTSTSSRVTVSGSSTSQSQPPPRNMPPEVITIDSDDEERNSNARRSSVPFSFSRRQEDRIGDVITVESSSSDDEESYPLMRSLQSGSESLRSAASRLLPNLSRAHDNNNNSSIRTRRIGNNSPVPELVIGNRQDEHELVTLARSRFSSSAIDVESSPASPDPEMPVLEPQVFSFIPLDNCATSSNANPATESGRSRGNVTTAIDRSRATAATTTVSNSNTESPASPTFESDRGNQNASRNRRNSSSERDRLNFMEEFDLDLDVSVESYSSPPPTEPSRPLRSPDFPILQYREFRHNFLRERDPRVRARELRREFMSMTNRPSSSRTAEGGSAFVAYEPDASREELSRPPRPSCSYESGINLSSSSLQRLPSSSRAGRYRAVSPSPAFRIDLYPHGMSGSQVMDLSRSAGLIPSSSSSRTMPYSSSTERAGPSRPFIPPSSIFGQNALNLLAATASTSSKKEEAAEPEASEGVADPDELECLGSFPIQKKPPLAVITLSSDDEDDGRIKAEKKDDMLSILSSGDEEALLDGFLNWGSHSGLPPPEFNLLDVDVDTPSRPLPDNDIYCTNSSSSTDFLRESPLPVASTSRMRIPNSEEASTSNAVTRSRSLKDMWQPESMKRLTDCADALLKSKKRSYFQSAPASSPPKKRTKRLQISSTSEESGNEDSDNGNTQSTSKHVGTARTRAVAPIRIPKKRMFVDLPSTPSTASPNVSSSVTSEDSDDSSSIDEDDLDTTSSSKGSKKRFLLPRKKHKLKSKKSKKSKKHKSKEKKKRGRSESGGSSSKDKSKTSGAADTDSTSRKGPSSSRSKHSSGSKSKEGNHPSTSSSASRSTVGLLDLSFRNDDGMPTLEPTNAFDLRTPSQHPSFPDPTPSSSLSTVDESILSSWLM